MITSNVSNILIVRVLSVCPINLIPSLHVCQCCYWTVRQHRMTEQYCVSHFHSVLHLIVGDNLSFNAWKRTGISNKLLLRALHYNQLGVCRWDPTLHWCSRLLWLILEYNLFDSNAYMIRINNNNNFNDRWKWLIVYEQDLEVNFLFRYYRSKKMTKLIQKSQQIV